MALTVAIYLHDRHGNRVGEAIVDACDAGQLVHRWCDDGHGYACRTGPRPGRRRVFLHRELLGLRPGDPLVGDHVDGDRRNNRRANLRVLTRADNQQNTVSRRGASSASRGVSWNRRSQQWSASAQVGGKQHWLGLFSSELDAASAAAEFRSLHMPASVAGR